MQYRLQQLRQDHHQHEITDAMHKTVCCDISQPARFAFTHIRHLCRFAKSETSLLYLKTALAIPRDVAVSTTLRCQS
jgi:hypothetical protein